MISNSNMAKEDKSFAEFVGMNVSQTLSNNNLAHNLILFLRCVAATYLKKNTEQFSAYLNEGETMDEYCAREVQKADNEADHVPIIALCEQFEHGVEINAVADGSGDEPSFIHVTKIPDNQMEDEQIDTGDNNDFTVKLLFVPGHYDILYH